MSRRRLTPVGGAAWVALALSMALSGCASGPPPADWALTARGAIDRSTAAWLRGDDRVAEAEHAIARGALARTGDPARVARAELHRCAVRAAALVVEPCAAFDALAADATEDDRAYARHLAGTATDADRARLPAAQREPLSRIDAPLSRLVAAAVKQRRGEATADDVAMAVDTASAQGWRRPLRAWLEVQRERALAAGNATEAARLARRLALLGPAP
jgi:hypothetical protein